MRLSRAAIRQKLVLLRENLKPGAEDDRASHFWASLRSYHLTNDSDEVAIRRSRWIAEEVLPSLGIGSVLELGCNTGRNLVYIQSANPRIRVAGIDVNELALEVARQNLPLAEFDLEDLRYWKGTAKQWDAILTMSVIDHVPKKALSTVARQVALCARYVVGVEMWDGSEGTRGPYKYSHDLRKVYESVGYRTISWSPCPLKVQYDERNSPMWLYLGEKP